MSTQQKNEIITNYGAVVNKIEDGGILEIKQYAPKKESQFDIHNENYKKELANEETTNEIIDKLNHYTSNLNNLRDLKTKLTEAGFDYLVDEALELKQDTTKLIVKNQNYKSAQKIITLLLSNVKSTFNAKIKPKLNNISQSEQLEVLFLEEIENELENKLGENVLDIYNEELRGMTFFLTGNCHIEWK